MALKTSRTVLLHTSDGTIKVTPLGRRRLSVTAPAKVKITDRKGRKVKA